MQADDYHISLFYSEEDECFVADVPDLKYCSAFGYTPEEALAEIRIAKAGWLELVSDKGEPVPPALYRPPICQAALIHNLGWHKGEAMVANNEIKELVRDRYGAVAKQVIGLAPAGQPDDAACGEGGCCDAPDDSHALRLYASGELEGLPAEAMAASLGCGNPTALAGLQAGERVLDLGSGGGIDCFLAARQVGAAGRVTGLDMTPFMIELAMQNAENLGLDNVEFVQGEMERMPLPDSAYDVIISNCVVNLSPDKDAVFSESFRVLATGGRIHLSDILALTPDGPAATNPDAWVTCIAGAEYREVYLERLQRAGFADIEISSDAGADLSACPPPTNTASFRVTARKPA